LSPVTRLLVRHAAASLAIVTTLFACALDWDVRPDPGSGVDGAGPDASDSATTDAPADTTSEAPVGDAADCAALLADVAAKKPLARACQLASGQCTTAVKDECDCDVVVALASGAKTDAYAAAVAAYRAACAPSCAACPQLPPSGSWTCLQSGSVIACFP
jgi:hypothetical protein